jgi:hypothetical protein
MSSPQDPQERFAGDPPPGTRDTGSDVPSGGEDRPSGTVDGDESVPSHGNASEDPGFDTKFTNEPPHDVEPAIPPYEGRQTEAKSGGGASTGANAGGATAPTTDPGGATASPADQDTGGTHRAEDRR